uniref:PLP-dependent transferase n=1 Tax=uncultured Bifidobacterium sp. TaxID=165187 RepID=UPI0028DB2D3D
ARHLRGIPHVLRVNYSGLPDDDQKDLVAKYLPDGVGTILSFLVDGDYSNVRRIIDAVRLFTYIPNIGDARSLIVDPARITHREVPARFREDAGVSDNLIRLSIGLEDSADLIADLDQAIAAGYED